jgi:hypothetical protein
MTFLKDIEMSAEEIDLDLLVFIERYVTNLLKWDLLTFFGNYPDEKKDAQAVAKCLGRSYRAVRSELGDLTMLELLQKSTANGHPIYQLTADVTLRPQVIKFAKSGFEKVL